jgi:DNA-3-methyladenine glycosylase II
MEISVEQIGPPDCPRIEVGATGDVSGPRVRQDVRATVERLLGIRVDLTEFYGLAMRDPILGPLAQRFHGVKPPRFPTLFETLVNAIACQQLSLTIGIRLLNRLATACGLAFQRDGGAVFAFPRPEDVISLSPETYRSIGWSRQKVRAITNLADDIAGKHLDLEKIGDEEDESATTSLLRLRGIGRWSAEYSLLRGLGRLHVFPGDDVAARKHLERCFRIRKRLDYEGVRRRIARWQPYAGLVYLHFLLDGITLAETFPDTQRPPQHQNDPPIGVFDP